jgi:hypothetical protein
VGSTILNAADIPLNFKQGTIPDVGGALKDWFQAMTFTQVQKQTVGFQVLEIGVDTNFWGVIQPLKPQALAIKPEGQRSWTWLQLHADPSLTLLTDEVVTYNGVQTRVMARRDYTIYGYVEYELVQDWTDSGPSTSPAIYDGGNAYTMDWEINLDGGNAFVTGSQVDGGNALAS